jgi:diguanylate cyclase (GGDEF)-like protein
MSAEPNACPDCARLRIQLADKQREIDHLRESLSRHDNLTGSLNRRSLTELVSDELQRSSRTGQPFCFALIGVDDMKQINKHFGHDVGDTILQLVAHETGTLLRTLDRFGRIESDEFGIILPATWLQQGIKATDRLNAMLGAFDWSRFIGHFKVTVSTGLTTNAPAETADSMIARARKGMVEAKAKGRGLVVVLEEELPAGLFAAMND